MITYRPAVPADLPQITALLREIMEYHDVPPPEAAALDACVTAILGAKEHLFLVADEEGRLVGMCALLFSMSTWSAAPVCEIQDFVVTRSRRRQDVGRGLMQAADAIARGRGCVRLFLLAEYWNLDAHAFYRRLGLSEQTCLDYERDLRTDLP